MKTSVPEESNHMPSWSDASDCTTSVLEDLYGLVFLFSTRTESEVFFRFTLLSRFCLESNGSP